MKDDLIKQLREPIAGDTQDSWSQRQKAANALEAKDAEIALAKANVDAAREVFDQFEEDAPGLLDPATARTYRETLAALDGKP